MLSLVKVTIVIGSVAGVMVISIQVFFSTSSQLAFVGPLHFWSSIVRDNVWQAESHFTLRFQLSTLYFSLSHVLLFYLYPKTINFVKYILVTCSFL